MTCASGDEGKELLSKYGNITNEFEPQHSFIVPMIVINGVRKITLVNNNLSTSII